MNGLAGDAACEQTKEIILKSHFGGNLRQQTIYSQSGKATLGQ